jgi:hypothetical protein
VPAGGVTWVAWAAGVNIRRWPPRVLISRSPTSSWPAVP